ncbi:MAG: hypothetical protein QW687_00165 [Candidatus Hadarchaeales archaeon]
MGRKRLPPKEVFDIWMDYLAKGGQDVLVAQSRGISIDEVRSAVKEMEDALSGARASDPQRALELINLYLINVEQILSQILFTEYNRWARKVKENYDNLDEVSFPDKLVDVAKEVHRVVLNRGQFLLKLLGVTKSATKKESEGEEDVSSLLFSTPTDLPEVNE